MDGDVEIFYFIILCERLCGAGSNLIQFECVGRRPETARRPTRLGRIRSSDNRHAALAPHVTLYSLSLLR